MKIIAHEAVTVESEGIALDLILWRRFRRPIPELMEALLALPENQHLAGLPAILPVGTVVTIPIPQERETATLPVVSLWN